MRIWGLSSCDMQVFHMKWAYPSMMFVVLVARPSDLLWEKANSTIISLHDLHDCLFRCHVRISQAHGDVVGVASAKSGSTHVLNSEFVGVSMWCADDVSYDFSGARRRWWWSTRVVSWRWPCRSGRTCRTSRPCQYTRQPADVRAISPATVTPLTWADKTTV